MKKTMKPAWEILLFSLLAAMLTAAGCRGLPSGPGQPENQQNHTGRWAHEQSNLSPDPELIFGNLDNGFSYVLMENQKPEGRVKMHLSADAGSFHESPEERGIAHFLEHMLFAGTRNFPSGELVKYFQRIGMKFGPDVNGRTGFYNTTYDLDLPRGDRKDIDEGLLVMRDFASEALLEPGEIEKERSVILAEKRTRDTPDYRTFKETFRFELPETRIAWRMPIGTRQTIENIDRQMLETFYHTWYRPGRLTLVAVGDFDPGIMENLIEKRFSGLAAKAPEKPEPEFDHFDHDGLKTFYHHEPEAGRTHVAIETLTRTPQPADSRNYQQKQLLSEMADSIVGHRLDRLRNEQDAPFTRADIYSGHYLKFVKAAEISAKCDPENWEESLSLIEQTLRRALEHGFTESEVNRAKKEFANDLQQAVKNAPTRENGQIAGQLLHHLNAKRVFQSPTQRRNLLQPVIDSATPEKLHEMLKNQWAPSHRLVLVTGNADLAEEAETGKKKIAAAYRQSRQTEVQGPDAKDALAFPYLPAPSGSPVIKDRTKMDETGVIRVRFENKVTLLVKKTDFTANQVLTAVSFGHGQSSEPQNMPALSEMTDRVMNFSGLGKLSEDELSRALAGTSTRVSFDVEEDKFVFSARSVPDETELMFQLLYHYIQDPGYRQTALRRGARQLTQKYRSLSHSVQGAMAIKGRKFLAGGDCRFGFPDPESVEQVELADIRSWITPALSQGPLEIAVVGDIDEEAVIDAAGTFFGALPQRTDFRESESVNVPDFPKNQEIEISVPTRISKALLVRAYPTTHIWDIHQARRLSVLADIFSDRMRIRIRENLGASYAQGAGHSPSRAYTDYGLLTGYAVIDPDKINAVEKAMADIGAELQANGATKDELKRALEPTFTQIREQVKTNEYWLHTVLKGAGRHPQQLQWSRTLLADYSCITVEEINQTAGKWLKPAHAADIRILPEPGDADNGPPEPEDQ